MRLLIVDDEELLRTGLTRMIERMELPVSVAGTACDGAEGLRMVAEFQPNVVLTDIRMPNLDGLELIRHLSERFPEVRTVILSGYDDFEFAKQAVRLGCEDYIVKPPEFGEMRELLLAIYREFAEERERILWEGQKNELWNRSQLLLQTDYLRKLVSSGESKLPLAEIKREAARLGVVFKEDFCTVALFQYEGRFELIRKFTRREFDLLKYASWNIASEIVQGEPCFFDEQERLVLLLPAGLAFEEACVKLQDIRRNVAHYLNLSFSAALSSPRPMHALNDAYAEAAGLLVLRLLREKSVLITGKDANSYTQEDIQPYLQQLRELQLFDSGNEIETRLRQWIEAVKRTAFSPTAVEGLKQELRVALIVLHRKFMIRQDWDEGTMQGDPMLERLKLADSLSSCIEPVLEWIGKSGCSGPDRSYQNLAVDKAIAFIREHVSRDVNLTLISEHVNMNPAYFSVMFKKKTGTGVVEYMTEIRMEQARKLLAETELKTYRIAEAVGYRDPAYFSNLFKRHHGMTPQEYRNSAPIDPTRNP